MSAAMKNDLELETARELVRSVVAGKLTRATQAVWDEDVLYLRVRVLEHRDHDWLLAELRRADANADGLKEMALVVSPKLRAEAGLETPESPLLKLSRAKV